MQNEVVEKLYSVREAAKMSGVGYNTLLQSMRSGKLRHVKIGRDYRVTVSGLNQFIKDLENGTFKITTL